jgi:hypothetical protein
MNWQPTQDGQRLTADGYEITAERPPYPGAEQHERWFTARDGDGKEVASGYGSDGLSKCKRYAEVNLARVQQPEQPAERVATIEETAPKTFVCAAAPAAPQASLF